MKALIRNYFQDNPRWNVRLKPAVGLMRLVSPLWNVRLSVSPACRTGRKAVPFNQTSLSLMILLVMGSCIPKEDVVFRKVGNVRFDATTKSPVLKADMVFYNPNKTKGKLKKIELDIFVNDKKAGTVNQTLNQAINGQAEFTVPIEVNLALKELGLLDTIINLFGGKKYTVRLL